MNRLCIYMTYNKENKIEEYIGYMLKALRGYTTTLYVVCNFPVILSGLEYIEPYIDKIFYRENRGLDAGAYKDMLCNFIGWDTVYQYDELILMNDSFFGPFYDFGNYFDLMENIARDFWGMTRHFPGEYAPVGKYPSHIQSYFLIFCSRVLKSNQFRRFWEELVYPKTYPEAILNYELKINEVLKNSGYVPKALTDVWGMVFEGNENPYLDYSLELIRDKKFPILKKKSVLITNKGFANALEAVIFIEDNKLYPTDWIWNIIDSQFYMEGYPSGTVNCLECFVRKYRKVYIYGAGLCGKNLLLYFEQKGWEQKGFLVSNQTGQDMECILFDDICIDDGTGIIISVMHLEVSEKIVKYIGNRCKKEQLFMICRCAGIREF
ncbi:MAG TPA: hypothetical protein DEB74_00340 [Lachnospiraceae bacterium]|nr:hypothetical protein [Lachnospiraceae bacterium]